jgi:hypothetical protein
MAGPRCSSSHDAASAASILGERTVLEARRVWAAVKTRHALVQHFDRYLGLNALQEIWLQVCASGHG